ncbi:hypothetical protein C7405_101686 [Paraburkholderia caballeronis]|uniref:1-pyrroline-5-carboxylate dehydrogenase n=1 Tax=Paraburkholderia caballeronis TaxID=416943 RepID=UPI001064F189|nr:1-pyrroline-5-carboxylate dehydrogenase [Paraburkholderia caballeronis]TDV39567.1 hypothetical protein C7405_101686 [Paraburkholderia caballeronis]
MIEAIDGDQIIRHLGTVTEATAKAIAAAIGAEHLLVSKALNRLHSSGAIERGKRPGGGVGYVYWLARSEPAPALKEAPVVVPSLVGQGAKVALVDEVHADSPPVVDLPAPANFRCTVHPVVADGDAGPEPSDAVRVTQLVADVARLIVERDDALAVAEKWRANCAALEARIDELTIGPIGAQSPLFVTIGRDAKPMRHRSLDKAKKRGSALVRSARESEVLVLEPIGRIVRGTEWQFHGASTPVNGGSADE